MKEITSAENPTVRHLRRLQNKKYRRECGEFIAEGVRLARDVAAAGWEIITAVYSADYEGERFSVPHEVVMPPALFRHASDTDHPQGVLLVVRQQPLIENTAPDGLCVYCDRVADPGNLGTIIRTADAFGYAGVILSPGCADPYAPKTVRATMGSICHIGLYKATDGAAFLARQRTDGFCVTVSALADHAVSLYDAQFPARSIVVIGSEAAGASPETAAMADQLVQIPMYGGAESLNAAAAAAVLCYEAKRQNAEPPREARQ